MSPRADRPPIFAANPALAATLGLVLACGGPSDQATAPESGTPVAEAAGPQLGAWGVDLAGMDASVKPGDDFYSYVNGTWHRDAEIPADKKAVGPSLSLQDLAFEQVKTLLDEAAADADAPAGSDRQKVGDWYATMLDEERLAEFGLEPIRPDLDRIRSIEDHGALADLLADNLSGLGASPLTVGTEFDKAHVGEMMVKIGTGGLTLPRELYLEDSYQAARDLYRDHVARVFELVGLDGARARADRVLGLEVRIAGFTLPLAEQRDPVKAFNPTPAAQLPSLAPGIDWERFLERSGYGAEEVLDVSIRSSIAGMVELIAEGPLDEWKDYCTYQLIFNVNAYLPAPYRDEFFAFFGKTLGGQPEPEPRWREAILEMGWPGRPFQDAIGKMFVERYVPAESRPQAREMVENLVRAFDARLAQLSWMTPETRANARDKLSKTTIKVLYPDVWIESEGLEIVRGDAIGNLRRAIDFLHGEDLAKLEEYPDKAMFLKPVFQVNAYANPGWNEIAFLAAIVRPPFFDPAADPAVNYGAMGAVIGHEVSHLFDDQGRQYDGDGLLRDWWTPADAESFVAATARVAEQMSTYEPLPGKHVNGHLTLGESIADVAGLTVAYDAYELYLEGKERKEVDGFTPEQRFFLAYAQMWRFKPRDEYLDQLLKTDFHPPTHVRPQTVRNLAGWYEAFDVGPGDALYLAPEDRANPWS